MSKVEKTMKKSALFIAFSWLLLMVFTVVSANAENISAHTPTSKNMVVAVAGSYGSHRSIVAKYIVKKDVVNLSITRLKKTLYKFYICFSSHRHIKYCAAK
uniref:Uncharacterized protein n=1 Tax=Medicago truncatula TaxID=3880 RepID=A2Q5H2_MEDTR|nr:hypothetical protein MtrDRAFT_AC161399g22v2 [Medicago truncatula]